MKIVHLKEIKQALAQKSSKELIDLCLKLAKAKKENKELLNYLLFAQENEDTYIEDIKELVDSMFLLLNYNQIYHLKKGIRKILRIIKKYIRYSKKTETEIELLIYFCEKMKEMPYRLNNNSVIQGIFDKQVEIILKKIPVLHEDLQYDFQKSITNLE